MFRANPQGTGAYNATGVRQLTGLKWKSVKPPAFQSSGSGLAVADGVVCFGSNNDQHLYGLEFQTGQELWQHQIGETLYSSPTIAEGVIYISNFQRNSND